MSLCHLVSVGYHSQLVEDRWGKNKDWDRQVENSGEIQQWSEEKEFDTINAKKKWMKSQGAN